MNCRGDGYCLVTKSPTPCCITALCPECIIATPQYILDQYDGKCYDCRCIRVAYRDSFEGHDVYNLFLVPAKVWAPDVMIAQYYVKEIQQEEYDNCIDKATRLNFNEDDE